MFTPIGFFAATGWSPSKLPNLYDWWEADSGVTGTTNVSQWTGKINGNNFVYGGNSQGPELVSTDGGFNDQSILRFDASNSETLYFGLDGDAIGTADQVNFSIYANPEAINASSTWKMFWGLSRSADGGTEAEAIGGSKDGAFKFYSYDGGGTTTTLGQELTPKQLMTISIDYANEQIRIYFGTTQDSSSPINESNLDTRTAKQTFALFGYNPESSSPSLFGNGDLGAVAIWTGNDDFSDNLANLEAYFQEKYDAAVWSFGGVTDELLLAYEAMAVSSATFTDTSGNGNDGTISTTSGEGVTWTEDSDGNFFTLHDMTVADTNYVDSGVTPTTTDAFSIDYVFQTNQTGGDSSIQRMNGWVVGSEELWARTNRNEIAVYVGGNEENHNGSFSDDTWIHLCITYDGSTITYYQNGSSIGTDSQTDTINFTENLMLHRTPAGSTRTTLPVWTGTAKLGAVTYYEKELSSDEVTQNYEYFQNYFVGL